MVKLTDAEQTIAGKEKIIDLLHSQLEQLKQRNLKSIDEAQDIFYKFGITQQKLDAAEEKCAKVFIKQIIFTELRALRHQMNHFAVNQNKTT